MKSLIGAKIYALVVALERALDYQERAFQYEDERNGKSDHADQDRADYEQGRKLLDQLIKEGAKNV